MAAQRNRNSGALEEGLRTLLTEVLKNDFHKRGENANQIAIQTFCFKYHRKLKLVAEQFAAEFTNESH